ncbi:hypothetical protein BegalDRAFT_0509 [Beggiatoa alba B18LD]|uniref:Uncharacterized protein n=1 Tax=Beggiatoa alba B18LD TaxID=395493 RepID=I3CCT4_9GAMM|nr:methyltransferase domain-containing protein [Beggiatoa alba]EIJ41427.1 hypothetical protein BegalDRAFT_0509 [Beggiatoa alba B18LD]
MLIFFKRLMNKLFVSSSRDYWETRYQLGGNSGTGSYGRLSEFKARVLNQFVIDKQIQSVIEFGCGDGHQLSLAHYPRYIGLDVSITALKACIAQYKQDKTKSFFLYHADCFADKQGIFQCDLALSLDVIYHLIEDEVFHTYMTHLFATAQRFVIVYASNTDDNPAYQLKHVKHRQFSNWVEKNCPQWQLLQHIPNEYPLENQINNKEHSPSDFFIYQKQI